MKRMLLAVLCPLLLGAQSVATDELRDSREVHFRNVKKLTSTGSNAEAYWSNDGKKIIFQSTRDGYPCDQLYTMNADGSEQKRVSSGKGRVTSLGLPAPDRVALPR